MNKKKNKITDSMVVPANGRPEEVKVGYRNIKIKYVRPDFIMDDMTDSYGEYRPREGVIYVQDQLVPQERCNTTWHEILQWPTQRRRRRRISSKYNI